MESDIDAKEVYPYIELLRRRGFLIEPIEGSFFLSDNSHHNDWVYLNTILRNFGIGYCTDTGQIYITHKEKAFLLKEMFNPIPPGSVGGESFNQTHLWIYLKIRDHAEKIPVYLLEPNIAYYIKALSACGIYTGGCCDGNHPGVNRLIIEFDYPAYKDLHACLWKVQLGKRFDIEWDNTFTRINLKNNRKGQYSELFKAADFIYTNREYYQTVRKLAARWMTKKIIKRTASEELKSRFIEELTMLLQQSSLELLKPIRKEPPSI